MLIPEMTRENLRSTRPISTMSDTLYARIVDGIISGTFDPGMPISLRTLASELGTSAMPVRDAMRRLISDGAVVLNPNRTFQLAKLSVTEWNEILELRLMTEPVATERAAKNVDRDNLNRLRYVEERMEEYDGVDLKRFLLWNRDFHFLVYDLANMPNLVHLIEILWMKYGPTLNYYMKKTSQAQGVAYHRDIIKALEKGDGLLAAAILRKDIEDAAAVIRPNLEKDAEAER